MVGMVSAPIRVELIPHSPLWAEQARREAAELRQLLGPLCRAVHHVGSTAVPDMLAKPVIDLLAEVSTLAMLDGATALLAQRGYLSWGEYGIPGRRYFSLDDPGTGRRVTQLHGFEAGHSSAEGMIAFRTIQATTPGPRMPGFARSMRPCNPGGRRNPRSSWACLQLAGLARVCLTCAMLYRAAVV